MLGSAVFLVGLSFLGCTQKALAVSLMALSTAFSGVGLCGFFVNHMDIAPAYAGTLMGLSNGISAVAGFIAPPLAAVLTVAVRFIHSFIHIRLMITRIPSGIWSRLYGWTVHGLHKSYTTLEARVESHSANHRPSRLGHVGAHDGL